MKVINTSVNQQGDDAYFDRLLTYFRQQFYDQIHELVPIRKAVFLLKTDKNTYVLKGYSTNSRLRLQEAFTATLKKEGFFRTYSFLAPPVKEPLYFEGTHFGCMEYIPPHRNGFTFHTEQNRQEGSHLLEQFHQTTAIIEKRYRSLLPKADLLQKWTERQQIFTTNVPFLMYFMNEDLLKEMETWANWSLQGMQKHRRFFQQEQAVILHGDVAHHNFLRDRTGCLYLIDFDLIGSGPPSFDYLQYANRILPYMDWSFYKLGKIDQIQRYMQDESFLYGLAYPADIFREWNRLIREKSYTDPLRISQVLNLSINQFQARKNFIRQLQKEVNKL